MKSPSYTGRRVLLNRFVAAGAGFAAFAAMARLPAWSGMPETAALSPPEAQRVAAVIDGDTLRLADGRELRLCGVEAPKPEPALPGLRPGDAALARLADAARRNLLDRIGTEPILLRYDSLKRDRYGRLLAQATTARGTWLQEAQVAAGWARVHGDGRNRFGLRSLLATEDRARTAGAGLWRHPAFAVRDATDPRLGRFAGSYQIVQGRVAAAALVRGTDYINFGADRLTDLTLVLKKSLLAMMDDGSDPLMIDVGRIAGRVIRCRGWLDLHGGPSIEISHPEQIEIAE